MTVLQVLAELLLFLACATLTAVVVIALDDIFKKEK